MRQFVEKLYRRHAQILRYVVCGGVAFLVDYGVLFLLYQELHWNLYLASAMAFAAGFAVNQTIAISFVFRDTEKNAGKSLRDNLMVLAISVAGLGWTELGMYIGTALLSIRYWLVKIIVSGLVMLWNYGMRTVTVYRSAQQKNNYMEEGTYDEITKA